MFDAVTTALRTTIIGNCRSNKAWSFVSGDSTTLVGFEAGRAFTTANRTVAIGAACANTATGTDDAVIVGVEAGQSSGDNTVYVGAFAGKAATGAGNVAIGREALTGSSSGSSNVAIGHLAMSAATGSDNVAIGKEAFNAATSSAYATSVGYQSLTLLTGTANHNTALGYRTGYTLDSGEQCLFLGSTADTTDVDGDNQIAIGYGAVCDAPNKIMMGNHRGVDMTMDAPPITVKGTATTGAGISLEHEGSTAILADFSEHEDCAWFNLKRRGCYCKPSGGFCH